MKNLIKSFAIVCVLLYVNNTIAQTTTIVTFWGAPTPVATLVSNDANDTNCVGTAVTFTAATQPGAQYQFLVNGTVAQPASAANTFTPSPAFTVGNQQVIVIVDNGTCSSRDTVNFVTLALPTPTLAVAPGNTICAGTSATFTATGGVNYEFKVNGITVQNGPTATFTTSTLTNGQIVSVDVTNATSCLATATPITMIIRPLPTVASALGNATPECVNEMVTVTLTGLTGTGPWTFEFWNVDGSNNATTLYYSVPGNVSTVNGTITVPIPGVGFVPKRMKIRDQYCPSFY